MSTEDGLEAFTGDRASAALLRRSLQTMADAYSDAPLGAALRDVLAGRRDVRELADDPDFADFTARGMQAQQEAWNALTPHQRGEQLRAGEAYLAELDRDLQR